MISRPPSLRRLDPVEPQSSKIERIDKRIDHSDWIVLVDPVVQAIGKQRALAAIRPLDKALHPIPRKPHRIISYEGFLLRPFSCRGPVWEFADRVQITATRSRRRVKNWFP